MLADHGVGGAGAVRGGFPGPEGGRRDPEGGAPGGGAEADHRAPLPRLLQQGRWLLQVRQAQPMCMYDSSENNSEEHPDRYCMTAIQLL